MRKKCLVIDCPRGGGVRGLCMGCYYKARRIVKSGQTTWAYLEKIGMSMKVQKQTGGDSPFARQYRDLTP